MHVINVFFLFVLPTICCILMWMLVQVRQGAEIGVAFLSAMMALGGAFAVVLVLVAVISASCWVLITCVGEKPSSARRRRPPQQPLGHTVPKPEGRDN